MPFLQQQILVLDDQPLYTTKFCGSKAEVEDERNRIEPELRGLGVAVYMNVGRPCHQY